MKKTWIRPQLVVLFRGKTGERVLVNCKNNVASSGAENHFNVCFTGPGAGDCWSWCEDQAVS
jgi:hypothetical protein